MLLRMFSFPRCYNIRTRNKNDRQLTQNSRKSKCVSKDACEILMSTESDLQEDEIKTDVISQCDSILVGGGIRKRGKTFGGKNSDISQWTSSDGITGKQKHVNSEGTWFSSSWYKYWTKSTTFFSGRWSR